VNIKTCLSIFGLAFLLNLVWEFLHSDLYVSYKGAEITDFILFRASVVDSFIILVIVFLAQRWTKKTGSFVLVAGLVAAITIELWAMQTSRWVYKDIMPIVPFLGIGLTPVVQLALSGWVTQKLALGKS